MFAPIHVDVRMRKLAIGIDLNFLAIWKLENFIGCIALEGFVDNKINF